LEHLLPLTVRVLVFAAAFSTITVFALLLFYPCGLEYYVAPFHSEPVDFYAAGGRGVSLDELIKFVGEAGETIYLPSKLPRGLKLTAVYFKDGPFIAIVVYSAEGNKDYKTAELTIEISPSSLPPSSLEELKSISTHDYVLEVNGWPVGIKKDAHVFEEEFIKKYKTNRALWAEVWIKGSSYTFNYSILSPTLTVEELIQLIHDMKPATQP
jgi:hypothetical protein